MNFILSQMQIIGETSFCHYDPKLKLPITIGTFPIRDGKSGPPKSKGTETNQPESNGNASTPLLEDGKIAFNQNPLNLLDNEEWVLNKILFLFKHHPITKRRCTWVRVSAKVAISHCIQSSHDEHLIQSRTKQEQCKRVIPNIFNHYSIQTHRITNQIIQLKYFYLFLRATILHFYT